MKLMFDHKHLDNLVTQIATDLRVHMHNKQDCVFVCVLNGGFMFFSDLVKRLPNDIVCDFVKTTSYTKQTQLSTVLVDLIPRDIDAKHVYIVDDIYDSGKTMQRLIEVFSERNPKSINVVTLFKRAMSPDLDSTIKHFYGTRIATEWLVGYGMNDNDNRYRNSNAVYKID